MSGWLLSEVAWLVHTIIGLSHVYVRMAKIDEKTTGRTEASSKDAGAGGGGSLGNLIRSKKVNNISGTSAYGELTRSATSACGT